jgi:hypothetical protein
MLQKHVLDDQEKKSKKHYLILVAFVASACQRKSKPDSEPSRPKFEHHLFISDTSFNSALTAFNR